MAKLTENKVLIIKKMIEKPTRTTRMKMIARTFGIGMAQLYRIKNGTNWSHLTE